MLRFNLQYNEIKFDGDKYLRDLDRAIRRLMREAARDWLIAVLDHIESANKSRGDPYTISDKFPIVTGEAKGSLIPLGRALHVEVPVRPKGDRENRIAIGMSQGKYEYPRERSGTGSVDREYKFEFTISVEHFQENEYQNMTSKKGLLSKTPWGVFEFAEYAFRDKMQELKKRVPRVKSYIWY